MDADSLRAAERDELPPGLGPCVRALWHAARGAWDEAHDLVQNETDSDAAWVHAWLHRYEGDLSNAAYWYRRAGRPVADGDLDDEWRAIATELV